MLSTYRFRLHTTKATCGLPTLLKVVLLLLLAAVARPGMSQGVVPTDDDTPDATSTPVSTLDVDQTLPDATPVGAPTANDLTATPSVNDPTDTPGLPATGVPATGVPATGVPATGVPATGVPATGVPATGVPATGVPAAEALADTIPDAPYEPSAQPNYRPPDRYGDPFSNPAPRTPLYPRDPTQVETDITVDDSTVNYSIYERINGLDYRAPSYLNFEQYQQYQDRRALQDYWRSRSSALDGESAVSGKRLIPPIYTTPIFDRLFGGSFVDIRPNGFVTLDFGGRFQRVENPAIPVRQQRNGNFEFDQQISLNVIGKIGEKLAVTANFDNNNSFDFQNNIKVEYTGYDHEIIKKIELGNVNLPVNNSLITGSQSLFGLKTQLQFGRLFVTSVASVQRGSSDAVTIENGSQSREFEVRSSEYDENRHFFLGHFFRDGYERWLAGLPQVQSLINVTRVEVYVINRTGNTETLRTVGAFMDLGEGYRSAIFRDELFAERENPEPTANTANSLFGALKNFSRTPDGLENDLQQRYPDFASATDYEIKTSVRKLSPQEYTFNSQLGYLTLNRQLQNDEMLAVAYEYTYNGQRYQVGELTEDYQNLNDDQAVFLKLLRPTKINVNVPTWDLMMKNVYSLNANQVTREGFQLRIVYRDDRAGIDNPSLNEGPDNVRDRQLVGLLGLDRLNPNNDPVGNGDGNFDFVEGITIDPNQGVVYFPVLEPFGSYLARQFGQDNNDLVERYVYDELYNSTQNDASLETNKDKFFLVGSFLAGSSNEIMLPGINISEGSVQVIAGNTPLTEGTDFTVDYQLGRVTILNSGVLSSGKEIRVTFEKADLFSFQQRTLLGTRFDYKVNDDINLGATILHLNERPTITRPSIGDEPTRNTKYGFDLNYRKESRFLTRLVDALPLIQTKEPSSIGLSAEFAQLIPGTSNVVNGDGTSYIDDFENFATPYNLSGWQSWQLAATPRVGGRPIGEETGLPGRLGEGAQRAKLAWYIVDNVFYFNRSAQKPEGLGEIINHYERGVIPQEVFPQQAEQQQQINLPVFDLAYFPEERGPFNYTRDLNADGTLAGDPTEHWGGITRAITADVDFDKINIEYIEFWMLDPFIEGERGVVQDGRVNRNNTTGGKLLFNLGSVSEDVIPDSRHFFEQGLPDEYTSEDVLVNEEGRAPRDQLLIESFSNISAEVRQSQDVGFDGVRDGPGEQEELNFFYSGVTVPEAVAADPSADNFRYYLNDEYDSRQAQIVERYKDFNGTENNTPFGTSNQAFTPSNGNEPDNEDLNRDNTLSTLEEYYEYEVDLRPGQLRVGNGYIVDKTTVSSGKGAGENWYLFRIPIRQPDRVEGNIQGFKTIRYLRTYLTDFREPVVLRFAKFQFVGSQWRRFTRDLNEKTLTEYGEDYDPGFTISTVNIEENSTPDEGSTNASPYVVPPGFVRDLDNTSPINRRLNEQSIQLCVDDLRDGDARAVFKNLQLDLINYGNLRLFLHAEAPEGGTLTDGATSAFLRIGNDMTRNYYEVEIPLDVSPPGSGTPRDVWPEANEMDIELDWLHQLKAERNRTSFSKDLEFTDKRPEADGKYTVKVLGSPDLNNIQVMMIGVRNPRTTDRAPQSVCLWANELRVGDFDRQGGWAVNARVNTQLADFANVTASVQHSTFGFGGLQSRISERTREERTAYDVSANVNLDKFFPEKFGLQVPMFVSLERERITPQFDPRNEDIPLEATLNAIETSEGSEARADYLDVVTGQRSARSLNFTNVRKVKTNEEAKNYFFDLSNFTLSYQYSEEVASSFEIADFQRRLVRGGIGYNYAFPDLTIEPFANVGFLQSPWLALIKDFNISPAPSSINVRADVARSFVKSQYRNNALTTFNSEPQFQKTFTFDRVYALQWNLTRNLALDYNSRVLSLIDEPEDQVEGAIDTQVERTFVLDQLKKMGRMKNFDQSLTATYTAPLDKIPLTDWLSADVRYGANYTWQAGPYDPNPRVNPERPNDPPVNPIDTIGNTIQNNRDRSVNGKVDMVGLYNKIKFLREVNGAAGGRGRAGRGRPARPVGAPSDSTQEEKPKRELKALKGFFRALMSLRSINLTYTLTEGTLLPGFRPTPYVFGLDDGFNAPGLPFLLGSQDPDIRTTAVENGWLARGSLTMPFQQNQLENIGVQAAIEPFRDFRLTVDFKRTVTSTYQEIFQVRDDGYVAEFPARSGNYNISYLTIRTAFSRDDGNDNSETFTNFEANREIILNRLERENPIDTAQYQRSSQDVLIPAFLAAYSGQDASTINLSPFPTLPLPNWRVDYAGLPRLFPSLSDVFPTLTLSHAYTSNYSVSNYTNAQEYTDGFNLSNRTTDYPISYEVNDSSFFVPLYVVQQVTITERFAPLIGVNIRTKGQLSGRVSYDRERSLALNMSNAQVTELQSQAITLNVGFTKKGLKLPFRVQGRTISLDNDITFNMAVAFKDTKTVQRQLTKNNEEGDNTITNGNVNFQARPTVDYRINDRLNLQLYFARTINTPRITNSFRRTTTEFGTQLRFNLAQ